MAQTALPRAKLSRIIRPATIVVAPDSLKGSLSAAHAAAAIERGIRQAIPSAIVRQCPMADGGEGTLDALLSTRGRRFTVPARGASGELKQVPVGDLDGIGIVEIAEIVGITDNAGVATPVGQRSTLGVGDAMRALLDRGYSEIRVALGGSSTNDAGAGLLAGLGARLMDRDGLELPPAPDNLGRIARIDLSQLDSRLLRCRLLAMSDVQNPLLGLLGATFVFGPQKGVAPEQRENFDANLAQFARCLEQALHLAASDLPGSGAAGGLGFALRMLGGELRSGAHMVADLLGLDALLAGAAWAITGEGRSDQQTLHGKAPFVVSQRASAHGVPVTLLSGAVDPKALAQLDEHFAGCFSLVPGPMPLQAAIAKAPTLLTNAAEQIARIWALGRL